jgi:hypothetical protein
MAKEKNRRPSTTSIQMRYWNKNKDYINTGRRLKYSYDVGKITLQEYNKMILDLKKQHNKL